VHRPPSRLKGRQRHFCSKRCEAIANQGEGNPFYGRKHTEDTLQKILARIHSRPNKLETELINLFAQYKLPFIYVGNGSLFIGGLNPDFVNTNGQKQVIELFGHGFHDEKHRLKGGRIPYRQTESGRKQVFQAYGFQTLVLWDTELRDKKAVIDKVTAFLKGGDNNGRN